MNRSIRRALTSRSQRWPRLVLAASIASAATEITAAGAQEHAHVLQVHGVPNGLPAFCAAPTASASRDGAWSDAATWSNGRVPGAGDKVAIGPDRSVVYDVESAAVISCVEIRGRLSFKPDVNTRLTVIDLSVLLGGTLDVGTATAPIQDRVAAEIVIADRPFDVAVDPGQVGHGLTSLGTVTMHGAVKKPTFARLAAHAAAGQSTLSLEGAAEGWRPGDQIIVPDTRHLRANEQVAAFQPQDERVTIAAVSGRQVTLTTSLRHDHRGAVNADGSPAFFPHVGNLSRNVLIRSERATGTRGHMIFLERADVDLRFVEVRDMGRTTVAAIDNSVVDAQGRVQRVGTNQIGRYAIHFHHTFGPKTPRANGRQFTLIGNAVVSPSKWGVTVHDSHYGLVQDNIVYDAHGAGFVTEDGSESFNVFEHNFAVRVHGAGDLAPRGGYGSAGLDPGSDGSGFWFQGPNNYVRGNVAATAEVAGFNLAGRLLGDVPIPAFQGADVSRSAEIKKLNAITAPVLEFTQNEAYGATQIGIECGWNGAISQFRAWNIARFGLMGTPTETMEIDGLVVRGDPALLADEHEDPAGAWIGNYAAKQIAVRNADIEGVRTGITSPFFSGNVGVGADNRAGSLLIERSRFKSYIGIVVGTGYADGSGARGAKKRAVIRASSFEPMVGLPESPRVKPAAISMNYHMAAGDAEPRDPVEVVDFNNRPGDSFKVYYSLDAPVKTAPCQEARSGMDGWVCK